MWVREAFDSQARCRPWHEWLSDTEAAVLHAFFPLLDLLADRMEQAADAAALRVTARCVNSTVARHAGGPLFELLARIVLVEYRAFRDSVGGAEQVIPAFDEFSSAIFRYVPPRELHARYPLLEGRIDRVFSRALRHLAAVFDRLGADFAPLQSMTPGKSLLPELEAIEEVGDPHRDGACVTLLAVAATDRGPVHFIYKPHPVTADIAFAAFLQEVAGGSGMSFRTPWYLPRETYGWVEHIPEVACADQSGVERYYLRLGWLLAVVYSLNGSDIHAGNVIAHGEHPVIVDLECLLSPSMAPLPAQGRMFDRPWITATGMVPLCRLAGAGYRGLDSSAFSGRNGDPHVYREWQLLGARTTCPVVERLPMHTSGRRNIPWLDDGVVEPLAYGRQFVAGFEAAYRHLLAGKSSILSSTAFAKLRDIPVRVVLRNTGEYLKLLYESTHPDLLRDGEAATALWETLPARATDPDCRGREASDLGDGIVPRFRVDADGLELLDSNGDGIQGVLAATGFESLCHHWQHHLSAADAADQTRLLEQCLGARQLFCGRPPTAPSRLTAALAPDRAALLQSLASYVASRAVRNGDSPTWFRNVATGSGACLVTPMDWSLSHGLFGMMFAAHHALQRVTNPELEMLASTLALRIRQGKPIEAKATRLSAARAGVVVLPALVQDARWGIDDSHCAPYFEIHQRQVRSRMRADTIARSALDLLLTLMAELHSSAARQLSDELADAIAQGAECVGGGFWSSDGVACLALARHAAARGDDIRRSRRLVNATTAMEAAVGHPWSVADGLGWLLLAIELHDAGIDVSGAVAPLVLRLHGKVAPWCLSALHGATGWMEVLSALSSRGLVTEGECRHALDTYARHVGHALGASTTTLKDTHWSSVDVAHGWAGVMLRLCDVSAISLAPPLGQV